MDPTIWLQQHEPGFDRLSPEERAAIEHFTLLWGLFEFRVLNTSGSAAAIVGAVADLSTRHGTLPLERFREPMAHFLRRYHDGQEFTQQFRGLLLRDNDRRNLVERVVAGQTQDEAEILSGLLIIVLRLRNNLFHGVKWAYGIQDQLDNFRHANTILMITMDLHQ